ncbi:MAG: DUF349 domain-containing protein [Candidatus Thiocaldithrix dubininis]|uniref:DUF349 domain-containing protein n=1 Tax=Candidatus Thiocaldithrix dubininis TaxID=3080823 RepID=A0AA95H5N4_9GAMM|nr:MAG: DUF349 domain-containing protein [Candidatus Thiocaldithrix dubininis]
MLASFFKPKWQHKDPKVRIQAINTLGGESVELIKLAQTDPDMEVRMEAIVRLTHLPTLIQLGHSAGSLGERAKQRVIGLAATDAHHDVLLADVFVWLNNPALIRSIARDATRGAKLRKHALEQLDDQDLLFDIAQADPSKDVQFLVASRLTDLEKIKQLDKLHGKGNKRLRQFLKDRLDQEQTKQHIQQQIENLCMDAASLGQKGSWGQEKTRTRILQQNWQKHAASATSEQSARFQAALDDFQQRLASFEDVESRVAPIRTARQDILNAAERQLNQLDTNPESFTLTTLDTELDSLKRLWAQQAELPAAEQALMDKRWAELQTQLQQLRNTLADDLKALEKLNALNEQANELRRQDKAVASKWVLGLQSDWVNAKRPQNLRRVMPDLEQSFNRAMEVLTARLDKQKAQRDSTLKALRDELQALETSLENEQYSEAIEQHQAFIQRLKETPDLPQSDYNFFQRRIQMLTPYIREIQDWRRWGTDQVRKQLIETAEHLRSDDEIDPQERAKQVQTLRQEWRKLSQLEPGQQRTLWKTFDSTVTAAYEPSKQHFAEQAQQRAEHLQQRTAICEQLEAVNSTTDWANPDWKALQNQVTAIRKQWKEAGTVSHKDWKSINERFNAAMDALEVYFKAERTRNWQARQQLVEQAQALVELQDTAKAIDAAKVLQGQWQISLASRPSDEQRLWKQFREPIDTLFNRLRDERQQRRDAINAQKAEVERIEAEKRQQELERKQQKIDALQALNAQSNAAKQEASDEATQHTNQTKGELLCLQLEVLLGLETPPDFQAARMEYQIAHLRDAMSSRKGNANPLAQALPLLKQWYGLGSMSAEALASQQPRVDAAQAVIAASF